MMKRKFQWAALAVVGVALVTALFLTTTTVAAQPNAQATATTESTAAVTPMVEATMAMTMTMEATAVMSPTVEASATVSPTMAMGDMEMDDVAAAKYCTDNGGTVATRMPYYGTNGPRDQWLELGGSREFCTFLETTGDATGFRSQISIALDTLYTDKPTLAVLAYLEPVALPAFTGANPSTLYCGKLGGTDIWGGEDNVAGGGWVSSEPASDTNFEVVGMCVFPDGSAIDSWGLTYKAGGVVRGMDLTKLVMYQPTELPHVFSGGANPSMPAESTVDKMLTNADNKSDVTLKVGDTLTVALNSNPSTGYSWKLGADDGTVLAAVGEPQFSLGNKTPVPGAGGTETFTFNAVAKGTMTLTLSYVRPWETTVTPTPDDVWSVEVTVE